MSKQGILAEARAEGYRDGLSAISAVAHDEAREQGRMEGRSEAGDDARRSFLFGFAAGVAVTVLLGALI